MKEIITEETKAERKEEEIVKKIEEKGYWVGGVDSVPPKFCIKKEKGLFKPKLIVKIKRDVIILTGRWWIRGHKLRTFIKEFEEKTGLELVKYI